MKLQENVFLLGLLVGVFQGIAHWCSDRAPSLPPEGSPDGIPKSKRSVDGYDSWDASTGGNLWAGWL